jgi:hypothetical protein
MKSAKRMNEERRGMRRRSIFSSMSVAIKHRVSMYFSVNEQGQIREPGERVGLAEMNSGCSTPMEGSARKRSCFSSKSQSGWPDVALSSGIKIKNPEYSQARDREELFER